MDEDVGERFGGAFHPTEFERVNKRAKGDVVIIACGAEEIGRLRMADAA
jgi:hypothetical protein